jgi:hypothetical protein
MRLAETLFARNDDATYFASLESARDMDAYARAHHGQSDPTHHYVAEQMSLHKRGYVTLRVTGPALGDGSFTVRDENLMGYGIVFGGRGTRTTKAMAVEWARNWQAGNPDKREVIDDTRADS